MKKVLKVAVLLGLIVYLGFAVTKWNKPDDKAICQSLEMTVEDSARAVFVTRDQIVNLLKKSRLYPVGKRMDFIDSRAIEARILRHPFIESATCFKTAANSVCISIQQRLPVLRVISVNGENYYLDAHGKKMQTINYPADVVIATGSITANYARRNLLAIGRFLQSNEFWNSQIEQLNVLSDGSVEMVPRVGEQIIYLGRPIGWQQKLSNLETFYKKVMAQVGWNKYSRINLEFDNQIICTKKT